MLILLFLALELKQFIWLLGFGILFSKSILVRLYEKRFDVPNWFHALLVLSSAILVLLIYFLDLGIIPSENVVSFVSTVPKIYATYVGLLAAFLGLATKNDKDESITAYLFSGIILNFAFTSLLIMLCIIGFFVFKTGVTESINLSLSDLFKSNTFLQFDDLKKYTLLGVIFSLSWLLMFPINMTAWVIAGKISPKFSKKLKDFVKEKRNHDKK